MKKIILVLVALTLLAGGAFAQTKKPKIFFTNAYYNAPYCAALNPAGIKRAQELGVDMQIVDGEQSTQKQLDQIKAAVAEKVAGIIYFPADAAGTPAVVEYLNSTKVPYVVINVTVDDSVANKIPSYVGTDIIQHGYNIAALVKERLGAAGGDIVVVEGAAGSSFTIGVTKGLEERLAGSNIKILAKQQADFDPAKAMKVTEDFLTKYGKNLDLIVSQDGGMLQGVLSALRASGQIGKIPVICAGSNLNVKTALLDGSLYATSTQDPTMEARSGVETIVKMIKGEKVPVWVKVPIEPCKKADIDKYVWF